MFVCLCLKHFLNFLNAEYLSAYFFFLKVFYNEVSQYFDATKVPPGLNVTKESLLNKDFSLNLIDQNIPGNFDDSKDFEISEIIKFKYLNKSILSYVTQLDHEKNIVTVWNPKTKNHFDILLNGQGMTAIQKSFIEKDEEKKKSKNPKKFALGARRARQLKRRKSGESVEVFRSRDIGRMYQTASDLCRCNAPCLFQDETVYFLGDRIKKKELKAECRAHNLSDKGGKIILATFISEHYSSAHNIDME